MKKHFTLLKEGLTDIYQLQGGILNFLSESEDKSSWQGNCFVFDERVTVTDELFLGITSSVMHVEDLFLRMTYKSLNIKGISCHNCFLKKPNQIELDMQNEKQYDTNKS